MALLASSDVRPTYVASLLGGENMQRFAFLRSMAIVALGCLPLVACGDDDSPSGSTDAGRDTSISTDVGARPDAPAADTGPVLDMGSPIDAAPGDDLGTAPDSGPVADDGGAADGAPDAGGDPRCARQDAAGEGACEAIVGIFWDGRECRFHSGCRCVGTDCDASFPSIEACMAAYAGCPGPTACTADGDCARGAEWCIDGSCQPCDNSGLVCFILCPEGWSTYQRNGCSPCECQPVNECVSNDDCAAPESQCYAGRFCWPGCEEGDPKCCQGNTCDAPGCRGPSPVGCRISGCPVGQTCAMGEGCEPSGCFCGGDSGSWGCTRDCGGGVCQRTE